ncbi:hypothetical protein D3C86_1840150 [compost metagenome]
MLVQDAQTLLHQHVVVGNVAGSRLERVDSGFFGKGDPDFRDQHTLEIKTGDFHRALLD